MNLECSVKSELETVTTKAPVSYDNMFVTGGRQFLFDLLWLSLPWEKRDGAPRRECWFNPYQQPYTYGVGEHARTYQAHPLDAARGPAWMVNKMRVQLNEMCGTAYDCCFINGYEHGRHHLGWHSDDSPEMDLDHPIAIVSLGAAREIWFRKRKDAGWGRNLLDDNDDTFRPEKLLLRDGSVAIMAAGMQRDWQHRIPKSGAADCGPRMSFTFRRLM